MNIIVGILIVLYLMAYTFLKETDRHLVTVLQVSIGALFSILFCLVLIEKKKDKEKIHANDIFKIALGIFIIIISILN